MEWFENHPFWRWLIVIAFVLGLLGGVISFAEKSVEFFKYLTREQPTETRALVTVKNLRKETIDLNSICSFFVVEALGNSRTVYGSLGEYLALLPVGQMKGTNIFRIPSGESRDSSCVFPILQIFAIS